MVTQGTNEGGSNTNRNRGANGPASSNYGRTAKSGRPEGGYENRGADRRSPQGARYGKPGSAGNGQPRYGRDENNRTNKPYDKSRGYNGSPKFAGKDDDDEDSSRRSKPSRPKESKSGVAVPDKSKVQLRLEKEQKSMKKKQQNKKKESSRPQPRIKRANNINYTKNYANGAYDEYEDYYD